MNQPYSSHLDVHRPFGTLPFSDFSEFFAPNFRSIWTGEQFSPVIIQPHKPQRTHVRSTTDLHGPLFDVKIFPGPQFFLWDVTAEKRALTFHNRLCSASTRAFSDNLLSTSRRFLCASCAFSKQSFSCRISFLIRYSL